MLIKGSTHIFGSRRDFLGATSFSDLNSFHVKSREGASFFLYANVSGLFMY